VRYGPATGRQGRSALKMLPSSVEEGRRAERRGGADCDFGFWLQQITNPSAPVTTPPPSASPLLNQEGSFRGIFSSLVASRRLMRICGEIFLPPGDLFHPQVRFRRYPTLGGRRRGTSGQTPLLRLSAVCDERLREWFLLSIANRVTNYLCSAGNLPHKSEVPPAGAWHLTRGRPQNLKT
jgi:hypothetical protein